MYKVTKLRLEKGWSISELARRAKINPADLSRLEAGKIFPYPAWKKRLSRALKVHSEELFKEVNHEIHDA
jgi:ribosome-binding protein aMBF1 (putative translation factor)